MDELTAGLFNPFASEEVAPPNSSHWEAKRRLAEAVRQLNDLLVSTVASDAELAQASAQVEALNRTLADTPRLHGTLAYLKSGEHGHYGEINHELNAVGGQSNPLAPGLNMWLDGNRAYGTVRCGLAYEGPPGFVHGGFVAAIFDQFLGMAQVAGGQPGMTGTLTVRYLRPTPLNTELKLSAQLSRAEDRKTLVSGELRAGGEITATAEGLFVRPSRGMAAMAEMAVGNSGQ
ncbi:PaaI family thioesterase [Parahaliea mediterranea]|uniref:Acyl-coenzyme A thioesterase THEM4 n=1 Tax=Parahaliea mediterranea TaxID=651086 RepID=A0A939DHI0_9GAMM|nr:PaaI family thioesterase [Parahaliea mediterranea]MBN7797951.1 PaaI family thioesterase [Parahaliea mediterranea]